MKTPLTPGAVFASLVSMLVIVPWATPARTKAACSVPGSFTSSV